MHRVAILDRLRARPDATIRQLVSAHGHPPAAVKLLTWMFLTGPHQRVMRRVAGWTLGAR